MGAFVSDNTSGRARREGPEGRAPFPGGLSRMEIARQVLGGDSASPRGEAMAGGPSIREASPDRSSSTGEDSAASPKRALALAPLSLPDLDLSVAASPRSGAPTLSRGVGEGRGPGGAGRCFEGATPSAGTSPGAGAANASRSSPRGSCPLDLYPGDAASPPMTPTMFGATSAAARSAALVSSGDTCYKSSTVCSSPRASPGIAAAHSPTSGTTAGKPLSTATFQNAAASRHSPTASPASAQRLAGGSGVKRKAEDALTDEEVDEHEHRDHRLIRKAMRFSTSFSVALKDATNDRLLGV